MFQRIKPQVTITITGLKNGLLKTDNENKVDILPMKPCCKTPAAHSTDDSGKLKSSHS